MYRGWCHAMQARRHAQQARSTGKSDIKPGSKPALQAKYRGSKQLWRTRPKQNAASQEIAAQCRLIILTHLVGSRAGGCTARLQCELRLSKKLTRL